MRIAVSERQQHGVTENQLLVYMQVQPWSGSIEMGVTSINPETTDLPSCARKLGHSTWVRGRLVGGCGSQYAISIPY